MQAVAKFVEVTRILSENLVTEIEKLAKKNYFSKIINHKERKDEPREGRKLGKNRKSNKNVSLKKEKHVNKYRQNGKFRKTSDL